MSEKDVTSFLQALGLSRREIQVYMFLAKNGIQSSSFAAKRLKMERVQAYRTFIKLQNKGFIEATLERPTRFGIVPFEKLVETNIESRKNELATLSAQKADLLASWRNISLRESEYTIAKFSIIAGKKKIHMKMLAMIEEAKKGIEILTTGQGLFQEDLAGILDCLRQPGSNNTLRTRIITEITHENLGIVKSLQKKSSKTSNIECRHLSLSPSLFPRFIVKDKEEAFLYAISGEEQSALKLEDEGLWINDKMFISILEGFFSQMWHTAADATRRIDELTTGTPIGETIVIKDPEEAMEKITNVLRSTQEDLIAITSSQGINNLVRNDIFAKYCKSLKFRLMAPLDLENLESAKKLSQRYEVRHVPINFMTMMLADKKHLFMFRSPSPHDSADEAAFYMGDTFYTNDPKSTERVGEMLFDAWKRGMEISQITSKPEMRMPAIEIATSETTSKLVVAMLRANASSILITRDAKPIGIISDREALREIVEYHRDPEQTLVQDLDYTPLVTLENGFSITDALKRMQKEGARRIAVLKNGQLVGMLNQEGFDKDGK